MSTVNCSYTDGQGSYVDQSCSGAEPYCCESSGTKYCTSSDCSADDDNSLDISTVIFWGVLGGLIILCVAVMVLVYLMCFNKNPRGCFNQSPAEELLGSFTPTPTEGPTSSTSQSARGNMTKTEHSGIVRNAGTSQNTPRLLNSTLHTRTDHVIIRVSPQDNLGENEKDKDKLCQQNNAKNNNSMIHLEESSTSCSSLTRQSQVTSIGSLQS